MKLTKAHLMVLSLLTPGLVCAISSDAKKGHVLTRRGPPMPEAEVRPAGAPKPPVVEPVEELTGNEHQPANGPNVQEGVDNGAQEQIVQLNEVLRSQPKGYLQRAFDMFKAAYSNLPAPRWPGSVMSSEEATTALTTPHAESAVEYNGPDSMWIGDSRNPLHTVLVPPPTVPESGNDRIIIEFERASDATGPRGPIRYVLEREVEMFTKDRSGQTWHAGYQAHVTFFYPKQSVATFEAMGENLVAAPKSYLHDPPDKRSESRKSLMKRMDMQELGPASNSVPAQTPREIFSMYLQTFTAAQAIVGAAITPGLHNVTSQTNNTLIHQMAASIYYDLTASTTVLLGPFNYGLNFLGNTSMIQENGKPLTANMTQSMTALESIYTHMWYDAIAAANATGIFQEMIQIAGSLKTNDTSVYPPGFMTVNKTAPVWQ